jgi:hypothetical protein
MQVWQPLAERRVAGVVGHYEGRSFLALLRLIK